MTRGLGPQMMLMMQGWRGVGGDMAHRGWSFVGRGPADQAYDAGVAQTAPLFRYAILEVESGQPPA